MRSVFFFLATFEDHVFLFLHPIPVRFLHPDTLQENNLLVEYAFIELGEKNSQKNFQPIIYLFK